MVENVTAAFQQQLARRRQNIFNMFTNPQDAVGDGINKSELAADIEKGEVELDEFNKAVYADTPQNRKLGRVGQEWHRKKKGTNEQPAPKGGGSNRSAGNNELEQKKKYLINSVLNGGANKDLDNILTKNKSHIAGALKKNGFSSLEDFNDWTNEMDSDSDKDNAKLAKTYKDMLRAIPAESMFGKKAAAPKNPAANKEKRYFVNTLLNGGANKHTDAVISKNANDPAVKAVLKKNGFDSWDDFQDWASENQSDKDLEKYDRVYIQAARAIPAENFLKKSEDDNPFEQYENEFQKGCGDGDDDIEKEDEDVEDEETEDDEERTDAEKAEMISLIGIKRLDIWKSQIDEIAELDEDSEEYDEAVKAMDDEIADYADVAGIEKSDIMNALSDYNTKLKFKKTGKEIKEQLQNVVLPELNANLSTAKQEADELLAECGTAPSHDVPEYWTGELHIEMPYKYYEWDETRVPENSNANIIASFSPDSYQKRCCKNAPASQDEAEARCKYNEQVRKIANISTDIKACEIVSKNLKDNESVELSVRQLVSFKFA